jgi:glycosyltransferase 2 family protein
MIKKPALPVIRKPWIRVILTRILPIIAVSVAAIILLMGLSEYENMTLYLKELSPWLIAVAVLSQVMSYVGNAYLLMVIMRFGNCRLSLGRGALIVLAGETTSLAGGLAGTVGATVHWLNTEPAFAGTATMGGIFPALYNTIVQGMFTLIGLAYLIFNRQLAPGATLIDGITLAIFSILIGLAIYAVMHRDWMERLVLAFSRFFGRLLKRSFSQTKIRSKLDPFYDAVALIGRRGWIKLAYGPFLNIAFDVLSLLFFFYAVGYQINLGILLAGYGLAFLFGRIIIPGGAGVIEGSMVAIFAGLGVPLHVSVIAVLGYRFISFWLTSLIGIGAILYLRKH